MLIIGLDYHPSFQQIAFVETETGEYGERRLEHPAEAEGFYRELQQPQRQVRIGMEASGYSRGFERLVAELGFELWIGDPAQVRAKCVRKQKTDRQDAQLLLRLLVEDRFPRIWVPDWENRDVRQLLWHRHRLVQMRTRVVNQLHAVALNEGLRQKKSLWRSKGIRVRLWRNELLSTEDQQLWNVTHSQCQQWAFWQRRSISADDLQAQDDAERDTTAGLEALFADADNVTITEKDGVQSFSATFELTKETDVQPPGSLWRRFLGVGDRTGFLTVPEGEQKAHHLRLGLFRATCW